MKHYKVIYADELNISHKKAVIQGLNHHAFSKKGIGKDNGSFSFAVLDSSDGFIAGLQGYNFYGCCHIDLLYVKEEERGKGYGSLLMKKAEATAHERNCLFITLNTMDFEGKPFYEKHGYTVEFIREGFEKGSVMYFLRKALGGKNVY